MEQRAERAGTPGFRAPEVLLRVTRQTCAIDVWSAGVMLCCLLAQRCPLLYNFQGPAADLHSLVQIMMLLGVEAVQEAAMQCGKRIARHPFEGASEEEAPKRGVLDTLLLARRQDCEELRQAMDLVHRCMDPNPHTRISALCALDHPFMHE